MKELRPAIFRAHEQGKGVREIASFLNITPMMVKKAWKEITVETLAKIVDNFPKRLKACVGTKGDHFE